MKSPALNCNECVTNEVVITVETVIHSGREWCYGGDANVGKQVGTDFIMLRKPALGGNKRCGYVLGDLICYDLPTATLKFRNERDILPL